MKKELLEQLKLELEIQKQKNEEHNKKVRRIKELKKDLKVKEYIQLMKSMDENLTLIQSSDTEIIMNLYERYLSQIKENETNDVYVYLGTYCRSSNTHEPDDRVDDKSPYAEYRKYRNIEQCFSENIPLAQCEQFEQDHIIIAPGSHCYGQEYHKIQKEFFTKAVKTDQELAKKSIVKKYNKVKQLKFL